MRTYEHGPIDLQKPHTSVIDLAQYGDYDPTEFSFEFLPEGTTAVTGTVAWTFEVSNAGRAWATIAGSTTGKTATGLVQRVQLPPVRYLRIRLSTLDGSAASRGSIALMFRRSPYQVS